MNNNISGPDLKRIHSFQSEKTEAQATAYPQRDGTYRVVYSWDGEWHHFQQKTFKTESEAIASAKDFADNYKGE